MSRKRHNKYLKHHIKPRRYSSMIIIITHRALHSTTSQNLGRDVFPMSIEQYCLAQMRECSTQTHPLPLSHTNEENRFQLSRTSERVIHGFLGITGKPNNNRELTIHRQHIIWFYHTITTTTFYLVNNTTFHFVNNNNILIEKEQQQFNLKQPQHFNWKRAIII